MPFSTEHVVEMVRAVFARRVAFHRGDEEIAPGVSVHRIGGHTMGIQSVRVWTERGWLVLASDAAHLYENMEGVRPSPSCSTCRRWWTDSTGSGASPRRPRTSFRDTIPW